VRDKILRLESDDIDFVLDEISGAQFSKMIQVYFQRELDGEGLGKVVNLGDLCSHLEVATITVYGKELDLNRFRKETYTEDTRRPQIEVGTAEEDAFRRDLTVNALFYNVNEEKVEDFTGLGLNDLNKLVARTPRDAVEQFCEDPERILRCLRYTYRFDLTIEEKTRNAMENEKVISTYARQEKISNERIRDQVRKLLSHKTAPIALKELLNFNLLHRLTDISEIESNLCSEVPENWQVSSLDMVEHCHRCYARDVGDPSPFHTFALTLATWLWPLHQLEYKKKKKKLDTVQNYILLNQFKVKTKTCELVSKLQLSARLLLEALSEEKGKKNVLIGQCLELVSEYVHLTFSIVEAHSGKDLAAFKQEVYSSLLFTNKCWLWKKDPLLSAREIIQFGVKGRGIQETLNKIHSHRLQNPSVTKREILKLFFPNHPS